MRLFRRIRRHALRIVMAADGDSMLNGHLGPKTGELDWGGWVRRPWTPFERVVLFTARVARRFRRWPDRTPRYPVVRL